MSTVKLLATMSLGLLAAACTSQYDRQVQQVPSNTSRALSQSERNCLDYGFAPRTAQYDRCVQNDARSRQAGRVNRDYDQAVLAEDARNACYNYGLAQGTQRYDNCVARELDARRYRDQGQMSVPAETYTYTQHSAPAPAYAPTPYVEPQPVRTSGQPAFRDEFGFRYDAEGNRLDRNGRIVSPQTTTP